MKSGDIDLLQPSSGLEIDDLENADGIVSDVLDEPILTLKAVGTTVVPKDHQRFTR